jgi:hypothetical protein
VVDLVGFYVFSLMVNDGQINIAPAKSGGLTVQQCLPNQADLQLLR